ncbi:hypothetical protein SERLA73DRAFT_119288 [Serpula lacrymans var. lacrymans S7.3]|uniref:Radical SAM core domain-containing protein n=1 Tax=Serpula lacrymans var. lacrymans (strain S7.3) TaxID=936435 RepID=F8PKQ1_SERL3|nr:hypothetical protein SERLA73DRAFT_119288 [Serpula lacrymans var. lacrymans S7.3]
MNWLQSTLGSVKLFNVSGQDSLPVVPVSVNYFPHRKCNYSCDFCFHTTKNLYILPIDEAKKGLRLLAQAGMKKLNISGGEPFLKPDFIGEIFRFCKEELHLESCSVVNNGSKVTEKWMDTYGRYLDVMAISCDSFDADVNVQIGRSEKGTGNHVGRVFQVAECLNWDEDMSASIEELAPFRWKVFQVLLLDSENTGQETGSLRDARKLVIKDEQFKAFLDRHKDQKCLVPEDNQSMKDSYLNLDEEMRFLSCTDGGKTPGRSLLQVGVALALADAGFDEQAFFDRGGVFEWTRDQSSDNDASLDW